MAYNLYLEIHQRYVEIQEIPKKLDLDLNQFRGDIRELVKHRYGNESFGLLETKLKAVELMISVLDLVPALQDYLWGGVTEELVNLRQDIKMTIV